MKRFLDHIIDRLDAGQLPALKDTCFVFPTQRACRHFEELLKNRFAENVFWSPQLFSIEEFVQALNPEYTLASEIHLLTELFEVYKKEGLAVPFEQYYGWGKVLLKDFDEVDRYLVDAKLLYRNLQDIKNIDQAFGPDEEALQALLDFQKVIDVSGKGQLFMEFENTWETVGKVYTHFQTSLENKGLAYSGMLYKKAAEQLEEKSELPFEKVVFGGFNALSLSEESIFSSLLNSGKAEIYFDTDSFYLNKDNHEAAKFLKRYQHSWKSENVHWINAEGFTTTKTIEVIGAPQHVVQAKIASNIIAENAHYQSGATAVVLADESLLYPVLYALPEQQVPINVTMGYPVLSTTIGELIKLYLDYQASLIRGEKEVMLPIETLQNLCANALVQNDNQPLFSWLKATKQSVVSWSWLANFESLSAIATSLFAPTSKPLAALDMVLELLEKVALSENELVSESLLTKIYEGVSLLKAELTHIKSAFDFNFIRKVTTEILVGLKVPFGQESGNGLQVMGFLETRTLDFDNLIVLSVNENLLPAGSDNKSFIPFGLRKAFKMPHFTEQDSIYAYHFYRLLQRAKNITLVYNTELGVDGSGEKSRYILQLANRIKNEQLPIEWKESTISIPLSNEVLQSREISIAKTNAIAEQLKQLFFERSKETPIAPTLLQDYIECPLRFYLRRVQKVRSEDETSNEIDAREFGLIVHQVLQNLYAPYLNQPLSKAEIQALKTQKLSNQIDQEFEDIVKLSSFAGKNEYQRYIIENTLERLLDKDAEEAPIVFKGLELKLNNESFVLTLTVKGHLVYLGGIIDRLDEIELGDQSLTRIIDYKTGKVEIQSPFKNRKPIEPEVYVNNYFTDSKFKVGLQSYFYALVYQHNHPNENVTAGIYALKEVGTGVKYVGNKAQPIPPQVFDLFEDRLQQLFEEILDTSIPFSQTENTDACSYCEFKMICGR